MQWKSGKKKETGVELRKRIKQLADGKFDSYEPDLAFSVERIELTVIEGKDTTGDFTIRSNRKLRGVVYSTHPRMECLTPQFEGEEIRVRYKFHSEGLSEGDVRKGEFVVVCDQGEYNLSFVVSISRLYAVTSFGKIRNLNDFTNLAREDFFESYKLFYSSNFQSIIKESETRERMLYEAMRKEPQSMQAVESFLVGCGKKQPVEIVLEETSVNFYGVNASKKEQLTLKKDKWGYVSGEVETDADFIKISKTSISSEDFLGSTCFFVYYIDESVLHAGKNFGRIIFRFSEQTLVCELCVTRKEETEERLVPASCVAIRGKCELAQLYIDYRLQKIVTGVWAKNSIQILESLLDVEPENELYKLMKAQAFLVNRQKQEASWILEEYKRSAVRKDTVEWGYYLYLCTLMEREEVYVNRLAEQIEELFHLYPDNSILFWILLFVRKDYYENSTHRLKAIEQWIASGVDSPYIYLEAYYLFWQDPYLLTKLGEFEIKILNWARKQKAISKDIAMQILHLVSSERKFDDKIYRILTACYEVADRAEAVSVICGYLIKGQKFSSNYHKWYELGVQYEVRITNLYEAYLLSVDEASIAQVPKVIFMYFQYHNTLSYKQLALLYTYIIENKEKYKEVYQRYRRTMEQFAMSQIEAGHNDEKLAILYKEMLPLGILNGELAGKFAKVLFVHKLCLKQEGAYTQALVLQRQMTNWQIVPIVEGVAYFTAITEDYCVLLKDAKGNLHADKEAYEEKLLLDPEEYIEQAMNLAPKSLPYLVYSFHRKLETGNFSSKDIEGLNLLLGTEEVSKEWKAQLQPAFVQHFVSKDFGSQVEDCLRNANYRLMSANDRRFMIEQLIENHFYQEAYGMLETYGYDMLGKAYRVSIASYEITARNFEEDDFLLGLADFTFSSGIYNDVILVYLCKYYNGPTKHMAAIWKVAGEFDIDTYDLEERIITQMLYSTDFIENIDVIYESFCQGGSKELICMAYLTYFSHMYLVNDALVPEHIFEQLEYRLLMRQEINDVQGYALLKRYAELEHITDVQYRIADALLLQYTCQGIYFGFYKKLDRKLVTKYHLNDKFFVEYHTKPGRRVNISYRKNDDAYIEEELLEVYDGIFVKYFILFFGDDLLYYVTEADNSHRKEITISGRLENHDVYSGEDNSSYALINDMFFQYALEEEETLIRLMKEYQEKRSATEEVFKLL